LDEGLLAQAKASGRAGGVLLRSLKSPGMLPFQVADLFEPPAAPSVIVQAV
jgi:hypothetical protein